MGKVTITKLPPDDTIFQEGWSVHTGAVPAPKREETRSEEKTEEAEKDEEQESP